MSPLLVLTSGFRVVTLVRYILFLGSSEDLKKIEESYSHDNNVQQRIVLGMKNKAIYMFMFLKNETTDMYIQ